MYAACVHIHVDICKYKRVYYLGNLIVGVIAETHRMDPKSRSLAI